MSKIPGYMRSTQSSRGGQSTVQSTVHSNARDDAQRGVSSKRPKAQQAHVRGDDDVGSVSTVLTSTDHPLKKVNNFSSTNESSMSVDPSESMTSTTTSSISSMSVQDQKRVRTSGLCSMSESQLSLKDQDEKLTSTICSQTSDVSQLSIEKELLKISGFQFLSILLLFT